MEHALRQVLDVLDALRNLAPEEHAHLIGVVGAAQHVHNLLGILTTTTVEVDVELAVPCLIVLVSLSSSELDATEGAALDVRLHLQNPLNELGVRGTEANAPTRHVMAFRHGVELDAAVLGARHLQDGEMLLAEDEAVGVVVDHDDVVVLSKLDQTLVGLALGTSACRHVGIVRPHQLDAREIHLLQLVEVGLPAVVLAQVVVHNLGTQNL